MKNGLRFYFNMNTCIGCGSCQIACKDSHNLLEGEFIRRAGIMEMDNGIKFPFSFSCNHCENPACENICPTKAIYINEEGLVLHRDDICIGCGRCYWACPYGEISLSKVRGTASKCDSCIERRSKGLLPACVAACPTESIRLTDALTGEWEKLELDVLPEYEETKPRTLIKKNKGLGGNR